MDVWIFGNSCTAPGKLGPFFSPCSSDVNEGGRASQRYASSFMAGLIRRDKTFGRKWICGLNVTPPSYRPPSQTHGAPSTDALCCCNCQKRSRLCRRSLSVSLCRPPSLALSLSASLSRSRSLSRTPLLKAQRVAPRGLGRCREAAELGMEIRGAASSEFKCFLNGELRKHLNLHIVVCHDCMSRR